MRPVALYALAALIVVCVYQQDRLADARREINDLRASRADDARSFENVSRALSDNERFLAAHGLNNDYPSEPFAAATAVGQ